LPLLLLSFLTALTAAAEPPKTIDLFNGKDLTGWVVEGPRTFKDADNKERPVWVARDKMISCMVTKGSFGFLRYEKKQFADFHLSLESRFAEPAGPKARRGNSGVGIRTVPFDPRKSTCSTERT